MKSVSLLSCLIAIATILPSTSVAAAPRPNVLFIMCDDLNDWALHPPGHPKAITPHMDRLRERSVSFSNAHVTVPVCGPSRKCLFSGLYPHTINDYGFGRWNKTKGLRGCVPLPLHFRSNGYGTYGTGKLIHEGAGGNFYTDYGIGVDYGPWAGGGRGWEHPKLIARFGGSIRYMDFSFGPLSDVPTWADKSKRDGWVYKNNKAFRYNGPSDRDKMPDEISAEYAAKILAQKHDRPFYLAVGFVRPHTPLFAPKKYFDLYPMESITLPPYLKGDLDDCAKALRKRWLWSFRKFTHVQKLGGESLWKEWIQAYLACVSFVDAQLGTVLDALEDSAYADNTIIVFTSDHGYHLGEKDCMQKWHLWEESTRVPLFIHVPDGKNHGKTCRHPVGTVDLYPTLSDLCGLSMKPNEKGSGLPLDGHSLRPFLAAPETDRWSGPSVAYMTVHKSWDDAKGWALGPHHAVRSKRYRYILCQNGEEELYDHDQDPHEWSNLQGNPEYEAIKKELRHQLKAIIGQEISLEGPGLNIQH